MQTTNLLSSAFVTAEGASPEHWIAILHGVFGMGQNFRTVAKRLVQRCPAWGIMLCDLRGHGASQAFAPPNTLASAAADVAALIASVDRSVVGIAGHSLGGKVTLAYLAAHPGEMRNAFVLDSFPGARDMETTTDSAASVLAFLESVPTSLPSREAFVAFAREKGLSAGITEWLAMNVRRNETSGYFLRLDLPAIRALLVDYHARDLWSAVSNASVTERLDVIVADRSSQYGEADRARVRAIAAVEDRVHLSVLPNAGHWLHVDAPDALLDVMANALG